MMMAQQFLLTTLNSQPHLAYGNIIEKHVEQLAEIYCGVYRSTSLQSLKNVSSKTHHTDFGEI